MVKQIRLWLWKRNIKRHQGFSTETNDFIHRIVEYFNSQEFINKDMDEQFALIGGAYQAIQAMEMIVQMNKTFNQFFDLINSNRNKE